MGWRAVWWLRAPTPPAGRCAPVLFDWSFTAGLCAAVSPARPVLPQWQPAVLLGRLAGVLLSRASPGSRTRLPVAAAFFFLLRKRNVIPAGPRQGPASLRSVRQRTLDMAFIRQDWGTRGKEEEKHKCRSNRPFRGQGPYRMFYSPPPRLELAVRGEHRHPQVHRCSTQPSEKPLGRRPLKFFKT